MRSWTVLKILISMQTGRMPWGLYFRMIACWLGGRKKAADFCHIVGFKGQKISASPEGAAERYIACACALWDVVRFTGKQNCLTLCALSLLFDGFDQPELSELAITTAAAVLQKETTCE